MSHPAAPRARPSLRTLVVARVVLPLVLTWAAGSGAALWLASRYVQQAYDRALLDDAYAVAAQVTREGGGPHLRLGSKAIDTVLFDQSERIYLALLHPDGRFIAGNAALPLPALADRERYAFGDGAVHGRPVRTVALRRSADEPFLVVMAQTVEARTALLRRLMGYSIAVQLGLLLLLALWLRHTIGQQLQPLGALQDALNRRDADDLAPLAASLADAAGTRDIQRLGGALNALFARVARSLDAQREFSGNVAHELRTPLAGIRAQAEFALAQSDPVLWREQLEGILRSEARASHRVDQLLALARADEAQTALQRRPVALHQLVEDAVLRWLPRADALGVDLGAHGLETPCTVLADASLIEGVLDNLIDNALRHGRGAAPGVTVVLQPGLTTVRLAVQDNGPGIPVEERGRLAQRGQQGQDGLHMGAGAGLGLAIARRYADLLSASFTLDAAPGGGLVAALELPRQA